MLGICMILELVLKLLYDACQIVVSKRFFFFFFLVLWPIKTISLLLSRVNWLAVKATTVNRQIHIVGLSV